MILETIGRLHPLLVHLPIGIVLLALAMEVYRPRTTETEEGMAAARRMVWLVGAVTALLSCVTGLLLEREGDHAQRLTDRHKWSAIATTLLACLGYAATFAASASGPHLLLRRSIRAGTLAGILLTGHFGGSLTHGEGYLTSALRMRSENENVSDAARGSVKMNMNPDSAVLYSDVVAPILQGRCVECHGPDKQKGGLRLDGMEALLKGGKNGAVLVKGDPGSSELYRRLLLPMEDEHHMPPPKKRQLTENEIRLLHWWILNGHDFKNRVHDLSPDSGMRKVLEGWKTGRDMGGESASAASEWPSSDVPEADAGLVAELRGKGILVLPVEPGKGFLQASLLNAPLPADSAVLLLTRLSRQLVWLKADAKGLTDAGCDHIARLTNLTRLSLAGSSVTDLGLSKLSPLPNLRRLNLAGTAVTERGLVSLGVKSALERLYLHDTRVGRDSIAALERFFPSALIDTGGYRLDSATSVATR